MRRPRSTADDSAQGSGGSARAEPRGCESRINGDGGASKPSLPAAVRRAMA
eukprot:NODE_22318_length_713_cov_2.006826.p5 GENE.NODE_22318_length_713_cov_2.006826~~NODE_22318_length_713_cov_2.006826.p5  ORF type:complete len:51 (+),score=8.66 NODE_22318_length_713_cov_2.006826:528-680(+)